MPDTTYSWLLVALYAAAIVFLAVRARLSAGTLEGFAVGSRSVGPVFIGLSLAANTASAATFVINPGLMYLYGLAGVLGYALATPLGVFLGLVLFSKSFRRVGDEFTVLSVPQWIGDRFGSRGLKLGFAVLSLLQLTFVVLIVVGLSAVLASALGVGIGAALVGLVVFTWAYLLVGGAGAHVWTNTVQAVIMIVVAAMYLLSGAEWFAGGPGAFLDRLAAVGPHYGAAVNPDSALFRTYWEVFGANFLIGIAIVLQPHIISKALFLRSEKDVNRYLVTAILAQMLFFLVLTTGLFARLKLGAPGGTLLAPDKVMATYLLEGFSPLARAVVVLGILSAGFSTLEGLLLALSTIFANDVVKTLRPDLSKETTLRLAKGFLVLLAPVAALLSWRQIVAPNVSVALFAQNGVYGLFAATFVPILAGIFFPKRLRVHWIVAAVATALVVHFGMWAFKVTAFSNNPAITASTALLASAAVAALGAALSRPSPHVAPHAAPHPALAAAPGAPASSPA